jgi:hypothetical protein
VNAITIVNAVANGIMACGVSAFMVMLYRDGGVVRQWPMTGSLILRLSLTATAAGSLLSCLTLSTPQESEVILNCGLAGIFSWAVIFHAKLLKHGPNHHQHRPGYDQGGIGQGHRPEGPNA